MQEMDLEFHIKCKVGDVGRLFASAELSGICEKGSGRNQNVP